MKFGCSLETVAANGSGPNFMNRWGKPFWDEIYRMLSASGFKSMEIPYKPYSFNLGRSGAPMTAVALKTKYGSIKGFIEFLQGIGMDGVVSLYVNANDVILDLLDVGKDPSLFFPAFEDFIKEALDVISEMGGEALVISPTPEIGMIEKYIANDAEDWQESHSQKTIELLSKMAGLASERNIKLAVRNDFWSLFRGTRIDKLMENADPRIQYSLDLAHVTISKVDPVKLVQKYRGRLGFIRFNDTAFDDREGNFKKIGAEVPQTGQQRVFNDLGEGKVNVPAVYKALKESGYDGWILCESKNSLNVYRAFLKMRWFVDNILLKS